MGGSKHQLPDSDCIWAELLLPYAILRGTLGVTSLFFCVCVCDLLLVSFERMPGTSAIYALTWVFDPTCRQQGQCKLELVTFQLITNEPSLAVSEWQA